MGISFEERQRALEAGRILSSQVFGEVFDNIDFRIVTKWRSTVSAEEREEAWRMLQCLAAVRKELYSILEFAAVKERGKDESINAALTAAKKGKMNG